MAVEDPNWQVVRGRDLTEAYGVFPITSVLSNSAAIYMWKRNLAPPWLAQHSRQEMYDWCKKLVETPSGVIEGAQISHSLKSLGFELVGKLDAKKDSLNEFLSTPEHRKWAFKFLQDLEPHTPPIYVGQTQNLEKRVRSHMSGVDGFGKKISEHSNLSWDDLHLRYCIVTGKVEVTKKYIEAMEYITQVLTISGYTTRAG